MQHNNPKIDVRRFLIDDEVNRLATTESNAFVSKAIGSLKLGVPIDLEEFRGRMRRAVSEGIEIGVRLAYQFHDRFQMIRRTSELWDGPVDQSKSSPLSVD